MPNTHDTRRHQACADNNSPVTVNTVGTSEVTQVLKANTGIILLNNASTVTVSFFFHASTSVTLATGIELPPKTTRTIPVRGGATLRMIAAASNASVRVMELMS